MATSNQPRIELTAVDRTAAAFSSVMKGLDGMGYSAGAAKAGLLGLTASLSAGALLSFARDTINAVDALNDVADATGSTVENISALQDVARRTGTDVDTVSTALVKFNGVLADADPNKGPGAILKALNLDLATLKRQDPAESMRQVAVAFQGITNDGDRARVVQQLFGKSVKEVAPYLKDLAEAGQLNATVTTEQAAQAEKFNKELARLQTNASNAARSILSSLVPALNRIFDDVRTLGEKSTLAGLASDVNRLSGQLKDLQRVKVSAVFAPADIDKQIAAVTAQLETAKKKFNAALGPSPRDALRGMDRNLPWKDIIIPQDGGTGGGNSGGGSSDPYADAKRYLDSLQNQLQTAQSLSATEKLLADIRNGSIGKLTPELEKQLKTTAEQVDATKALAEATKQRAENQKALDDLINDVDKKDNDRLSLLVSAGATEQLQKQRDEMQYLADAYEQGRLGIVGSTEALTRYTEAAQAFLGINDEAMKSNEDLAKSALQAGERIQNALGDQLFNLIDGKFSDIGDAFTNMLKRMAAEAAAAQIMDALFGSVGANGKQRTGGALGNIGSLLSFLPSFEGGGFTGSGGRSGGVDGRGGFLSVLHPNETVSDHTKGQGAGQVVIHINNTVGDVASVGVVERGMQTVRAQIMGELQRSRTYGGAAA